MLIIILPFSHSTFINLSQSVVQFYTTVINRDPLIDSGTRVFADKLKDIEPAKTMPKAKKVCRLTT